MIKDFSEQLGKKLVLKSVLINIQDIEYIYCEDYICSVFYLDKKISVAKQLCEFETEFEGLGFFRINRTVLVNLYHIAEFDLTKKEIILTYGNVFPVSRRKMSDIKKCLVSAE